MSTPQLPVHKHVHLIQKHTQVTTALTPAERDLLSGKLASLAKALEPGLSRLNWNSRGIDDFVAKAGAAVHDFKGLVNQVRSLIPYVIAAACARPVRMAAKAGPAATCWPKHMLTLIPPR